MVFLDSSLTFQNNYKLTELLLGKACLNIVIIRFNKCNDVYFGLLPFFQP